MRKQINTDGLPERNARVAKLVNHFAKGNVTLFVSKLEGKPHQVINRLFNPDARNKKYPGVSSDIVSMITAAYPEVRADWILNGSGEMVSAASGTSKSSSVDPEKQYFTADQLFAMYVDLAKTQSAQLDRIENQMAKEKTQIDVKTNLEDVLDIVEKLSLAQNKAIPRILKEFAFLREEKGRPKAIGRRKAGNGAGA